MRLGREGAPHGAAVAARLAARLREELAALEGENDDYDTLFRNGKILGTEAVFQSAWAKAFRRLIVGGATLEETVSELEGVRARQGIVFTVSDGGPVVSLHLGVGSVSLAWDVPRE